MVERNHQIWDGRIFPALGALIESGYLSLEIEGAELARQALGEPLVYAANHSGWIVLDMIMCAKAIRQLGWEAFPYTVVADALLKLPVVRHVVREIGGLPASILHDPSSIPDYVRHVGVFPEGAEGNSKPFWQAYRLQRWRTGFVRVALFRRATVIPIAIVGGEEALPVAWKIRASKPLIGTVMPLPLVPILLPSKWKVRFLEPIRFQEGPEVAEDYEACTQIAADVQARVQRVLDAETQERKLGRLARWLAERNAGVGG